MATVGRTFHFESAHWLPKTAETHKCHRVHGHNYRFEVILSGQLDDKGWLIDFWDIDAAVQPIIDRIDHRCLNDIEGLENPTAEIIAEWLCQHIANAMHGRAGNIGSVGVRLWETPDAYAYSGGIVLEGVK